MGIMPQVLSDMFLGGKKKQKLFNASVVKTFSQPFHRHFCLKFPPSIVLQFLRFQYAAAAAEE
jgi:hypothetical protein